MPLEVPTRLSPSRSESSLIFSNFFLTLTPPGTNITQTFHNQLIILLALLTLFLLLEFHISIDCYLSDVLHTLQDQRSVLLSQNRFMVYIFLSIPEMLHSHHLGCTEPTVLWSAPGKPVFFVQEFSLQQCGHYLTQL